MCQLGQTHFFPQDPVSGSLGLQIPLSPREDSAGLWVMTVE